MLLPGSHTTLTGPGTIKQVPRNWNDPDNSTRNGGTIMPWHGGYGTETPLTQHTIVTGLQLNGNKASHYGKITNRTNGEGINFKYGRNCVALYNVIWDVDGDGIDFDYTRDSLAIGNKITNPSGWGIHHSNGNKNNRIIANHAVLCGWDLHTDSGVTGGGFDCSQDTTDITYIGNIADGCRINYALGTTGYDPNLYRLISVGNRSLTDAATPALDDAFTGCLAVDAPRAFDQATTFNQAVLLRGSASLQAFLTSANASAITIRADGDAQPRFSQRGTGMQFWGDGTAAADVSLGRTGANELTLGTGDPLRMDGTWQAPMRFSNYRLWIDAGAMLRIKGATAPTSDTDGDVVGGNANSGTTAQLIAASNTRNTVGKFAGRLIWSSNLGRPVWASGSGATDPWKVKPLEVV